MSFGEFAVLLLVATEPALAAAVGMVGVAIAFAVTLVYFRATRRDEIARGQR